MTIGEIGILVLTGIGGGLLSSMAGMASLIVYPVLLALGVSPVSANVTNTAAMIFTGVGSGLASTRELRANRRLMVAVTGYAVAGGILGAMLLAVAPGSTFERVVPFLIAIAGGLMLWSARTSPVRGAKGHVVTGWRLVGRNAVVLLVGLYIGYFGAAAGIVMLAILSLTLPVSFAVANALKNFATLLTNIVALVIYAFTTKVYWLMVLPLGVGMFIGGYLGPLVVRHVPQRALRIGVGIAAFGLAAYFFWTAYLK
ncbi:sulfite exporter TauE/SafE family protein [Lacticaseibacillus nasuensis]|uniref:sulfite exporter TauE/SafE family protein n=1 Tax=Lacticaseibacillus nasuensis TaxID=944671 RepID=UPI0022477D8F|nr:sulfite exporter TauE/SafE family protein [Lacticaseibacillus nasuensis]MCX2455089.1 sulfite exporter TauE/SafE family protein [Lacticaseibacillus nasuensis]